MCAINHDDVDVYVAYDARTIVNHQTHSAVAIGTARDLDVLLEHLILKGCAAEIYAYTQIVNPHTQRVSLDYEKWMGTYTPNEAFSSLYFIRSIQALATA